MTLDDVERGIWALRDKADLLKTFLTVVSIATYAADSCKATRAEMPDPCSIASLALKLAQETMVNIDDVEHQVHLLKLGRHTGAT